MQGMTSITVSLAQIVEHVISQPNGLMSTLIMVIPVFRFQGNMSVFNVAHVIPMEYIKARLRIVMPAMQGMTSITVNSARVVAPVILPADGAAQPLITAIQTFRCQESTPALLARNAISMEYIKVRQVSVLPATGTNIMEAKVPIVAPVTRLLAGRKMATEFVLLINLFLEKPKIKKLWRTNA